MDGTTKEKRHPASRSLRVARSIVCFLLLIIPGTAAQGQVRKHASEEGRTLWMHSDGTYESAYAAQYGECVPPDYGSFAERYEGVVEVLAIVLDLTDAYGFWETPYVDAYVWADADGAPGEVLDVLVGFHVWYADGWPEWTRVEVEFPAPVCVSGRWWVGYWGAWPHLIACFGICADLDGPGGGSPMMKIAPGLQWPEGWQDVEVRWGPTAALGIGAEVEEAPSPPASETWGLIKDLFR